jgi:hypothetical protein
VTQFVGQNQHPFCSSVDSAIIPRVFLFSNFVISMKWLSSIKWYSQIWLQTRYESRFFFSKSFYILGSLLEIITKILAIWKVSFSKIWQIWAKFCQNSMEIVQNLKSPPIFWWPFGTHCLNRYGNFRKNSLSMFGDIGAFFPQKKSFAPSHTRFVVELMVRKFAPQFFFNLFWLQHNF